MKAMPEELSDRLWKAVIAKRNELKGQHPYRATNESAAYHSAHSVMSIVDISLLDGCHVVYRVEAWGSPAWQNGKEPGVQVTRWFHNAEEYWEDLISRPDNAVIVDAIHYRLGKNTGPMEYRGFAGRRFHIRFHDGCEVTTNDLWYQGPIPPVFRDRLPDNATFVTATEVAAR